MYIVSSFWARVEIKTFALVIVIYRVGDELNSAVQFFWKKKLAFEISSPIEESYKYTRINMWMLKYL